MLERRDLRFHASEGQADRPDWVVPKGGQGLDPTRLWRIALRRVCSAMAPRFIRSGIKAFCNTVPSETPSYKTMKTDT